MSGARRSCLYTAGLGLSLLLTAGGRAEAQSLFYPRRVNWTVAAGYSAVSLSLDLPRDLRIHDNHRDDPFTGDAGQTDLAHVELGTLDLEGGIAYRPGDVNAALIVRYVAKIPIRTEGRAERQQANDPRPPAYGSYIYTKASDVGVGHVLRTGLGLAAPLSSRRGWWIEFQGLLDVGRWEMRFDKGWTRFGRDEPETASTASGIYVTPRLQVAVGTPEMAFRIGLGRTQVAFHQDDPRLANHTGQGLEVSVGTHFRF